MSERSVRMTDPRALRAVAHRVRLALLGELRRHGPMTATQAAPRVGESVASCSFHFRQLAKYGMVEPAPTAGGREKPWRPTADVTTFELAPDDPELAEASRAFARVVIERYAQQMKVAVDNSQSEPPEWRDAILIGDSIVHLTAGELSELRLAVEAIAERYRDIDPEGQRSGTRPVSFIHWAIPQ